MKFGVNVAYLDINWKTDTFVLNKELTDEWEFKSTSLLYFKSYFLKRKALVPKSAPLP